MSALLHAAVTKFDEAYAEVRTELAKLLGQAATDATDVAHEAEAGVAPAVATAEHDAATLATTAVADVETAVQPATATPAAG